MASLVRLASAKTRFLLSCFFAKLVSCVYVLFISDFFQLLKSIVWDIAFQLCLRSSICFVLCQLLRIDQTLFVRWHYRNSFLFFSEDQERFLALSYYIVWKRRAKKLEKDS